MFFRSPFYRLFLLYYSLLTLTKSFFSFASTLMADERWSYYRFRIRSATLLIMCLLCRNVDFSHSLNDEGLSLLRFRDRVRDPYGALFDWRRNDGEEDPCLWSGIECSQGRVVSLSVKNLCLEGMLAPELGNLIHLKAIVLRNNSFSGSIPKEITELKNLEVLDLGFNNFSGPLVLDIASNLSLTILLLDNNEVLQSMSPEVYELWKLSENQVDETLLSGAAHGESCKSRFLSWNIVQSRDATNRRLLESEAPSVPPKASKPKIKTSKAKAPQAKPDLSPALPPLASSPLNSPSPSSLTSPSASPTSRFFLPSSPYPAKPPIFAPIPSPSVSLSPSNGTNSLWTHSTLIIVGAVGAATIISMLLVCVLLLRGNKTVIVNPWATGISGQLQKAFVTGVPKLKRSELETACEDFSNVISSSSEDTVYKGTLSSGVEIAVTSTTITSSNDWPKNLEEAFRKKIDTLSKVNHKNFVNLLGYCEEEKPFTRMMIFEYAPNGTLFEHLHIKESDHLDWGTRLRIAMGIAYCLEHMHQLSPPVIHKKLHSSTIYLTEDYAAKISDFGFWNEATMAKMRSAGMDDTSSTLPENNIYNFGVILLEMVTGRLSNSLDDGPVVDWASDFLTRKKLVKDMVDPTLTSFKEVELEKLSEVIAYCIHSDPNHRPTMNEVTARLREITLMTPERATPRASPLWWAELEIISTEGS